jgi:LacI family transcriptional regulator
MAVSRQSKSSHPTLVDVARVAGVSKSTVSRVLQGGGASVKTSTQQVVWQAIQELGYAPNAIARSMRTDRTYMLMLIVPDITNPFWPEVARGVQDTVEREGYSVVLGNSDWMQQREELLLRTARNNRFDGVAINRSSVSAEELQKLGIPVVLLGLRNGYTPFDMVGSDSFGGIAAALEYLFQLRHRRIGFIHGQHITDGQSRIHGYLDFLQHHGLAYAPELVVHAPFELEAGKRAALMLLCLPERPTAILASNDMLAIGALQGAASLGITVPEALSIVGMDDIYPAAITTPPLTTMAKAKYETGVAVARCLLERIAGTAPAHGRRIAIPCQLVVRGTTAARSGAARSG